VVTELENSILLIAEPANSYDTEPVYIQFTASELFLLFTD
jgi:hypothetical protein